MSALAPIVYTEHDLDELHIYTRKTRYRKRRVGKFPSPIPTEEGQNLYRVSDIERWIESPAAWAAEHIR